jgi:hypothetical protein
MTPEIKPPQERMKTRIESLLIGCKSGHVFNAIPYKTIVCPICKSYEFIKIQVVETIFL